MSQPQAVISDTIQQDIATVQSNIGQLQSIFVSPDTPQEDKPYIRNAIVQAQLAIAAAQQGQPVNLEQFKSLESMLRGGLEREMRGQEITNIFNIQASIADQIKQIDAQLISEVISEEQRQALEQEKVGLSQQLSELQQRTGAVQAAAPPAPTRATMAERRLSPEAQVALDEAVFQERVKRAMQDGLSLEAATARARREMEQMAQPMVLDPSGQQALMAQVVDPAKRVDFAAGTIQDPETGQVRPMTAIEMFAEAGRPQVLGVRENTGQVFTGREALSPILNLRQPAKTVRAVSELEPSDIVEDIAELKKGPSIEEVMAPTPITVDGRDILVESPMMYTLRLAGAVPSAATAVITDALTYTVDDEGNPIDPTDVSYKINQLGLTQAYNQIAPAISFFQPVKSDRAWANATSTLNAAAAGVAEGTTFFEVKKAAPNLNIDMKYYQDKFADGSITPLEYASVLPFYLGDTALGAGALIADILMPLDPLVYAAPVTKTARLGVRLGTRPTYEVVDYLIDVGFIPTKSKAPQLKPQLYRTSKDIQDALTRLERLETGQLAPWLNENLRAGQASSIYKQELNSLVDDALQGNYQSAVKGATISSVQDNAAREIAGNLTDLQMHRIYGDPVNEFTNPFVRKVLDDGYKDWHNATRQKDSPFAGALAISDEIATDVRLLRQGGTVPKASLYGSAFRSNLMRAGVKKGRYRGKLLESYRLNNPDAVPDDFYRLMVEDPEILQEAMNKTIKDAVKDELFGRLPVNQIMVGGNRIVNIGHWSAENQRKVADMVSKLTALDEAGRLIANSDEMIDAFVAGVGLDEVRSSRGLQRIVEKLDNKQKLTPEEYRIYEQSVIGHAWDTAVEDTRQPILMTQTAYIEAAEMRSNSVAQARARVKAIEYTKSIRQDARGLKEKIIGTFSPKSVLKTRQQMIQSGEAVTTNRALLSSVKIKDPAVSKTPKPYLDLQYRVNNLRSTSFDQLINDIERYMKQDRDGTVVLNRLLVNASDEQIRVQYSLVNARFEREYAHLLKSMPEEEALETAYKRAIQEITSEQRFNSWLDGSEIVPLQEVPDTLYNAVVEEQLYRMMLRFFDNIWFAPATKDIKTRGFQRIIRQAASDADDLNTALLQETAAKLIENNPDLKSFQLRTITSGVSGVVETELAWTEAFTLLTLGLRGEVMMKAGIDELLMLYPSMYMDLVLTPIQKLNKSISAERITKTTTEFLFDTEKHPLFYAFNNYELQESFRQAAAGTKFADQAPNLQAAKQRFENSLNRIFAGKSKDYKENVFRAARNLFNVIDSGAEKVLMMSSRDLGGFATSMTQAMVQAKVANKGPSRNLTKLIQDNTDYATTYTSFDEAIVALLKAGDFDVKAIPKYKRAGISSLFGLNGAYTGNIADLQLMIQNSTGPIAGTAPLVYIEKEIDNMLRSYGVTIGPTTTDNFAAEVISMYRPYLEILDTEGVALIMGREMQQEFQNLVNKARGEEWTDIIGSYRAITDAFNEGPLAVAKLNTTYLFNNALDIMTRISTTGLLGGFVAPNTRYLGVNFFSAPLLMATELGISDTLRSLSWLHADHLFVSGRWNPDDVLMVTKNGQTITYGQYADLVSTENIATTFSAAQFQKTSMSELMRELALTSGFQEASKSQQFVRWYLDPSKRTRYTMWSHYTDMRLRRATFTQALYDGLTPQQAATRSREALLDYGKARDNAMTQAAGATIAFWSFQWMSFKGLVGALWRGKGDAVRLMRAQEGYAKQQESYYVGNTREHARIFRFITEKGIERNEMAVGFYNPAYESMGILVDGMAYVAAIGAVSAYDDANMTSRQLGEQFMTTLVDRAPLMPLTNIALSIVGMYKGMGKTNPYQGTRFLPPAYIPLMEKNAVFAQEMKYYFGLDMVAPREGDPSYKGQSYKFRTAEDERYFFMLEHSLFMIGVQRRLLDGLKAGYAAGLGVSELQYDRGYYSAVTDLYRQAGMSDPMTLQMSAALSYELGLISMTRDDTPEAMFIRAELQQQKKKEAEKPTK